MLTVTFSLPRSGSISSITPLKFRNGPLLILTVSPTSKLTFGLSVSSEAEICASEETEKPKVNFAVGETVKINNGPFLNFSGVIEEIDPERGKLKVTVNIFGRNTPVELEYWQVEKA